MPDEPKPKNWWQWFLLYPTLGISLLGMIPGSAELYRVFKTGGNVPIHQTKFAMEQKSAWERNADCLVNSEMHEVVNPSNIKIGVRICPFTGDVQIQGYVPGNPHAVYRWVPLSKLINVNQDTGVVSFSLFPKAVAAEMLEHQTGEVLCQRWLGNGILLQRIYWPPNDSCYDNVINTYTGNLIRSDPAPCNRQC